MLSTNLSQPSRFSSLLRSSSSLYSCRSPISSFTVSCELHSTQDELTLQYRVLDCTRGLVPHERAHDWSLLSVRHLPLRYADFCRPSGAGTIITTFIVGRMLDYYYQREEARVGGDFRKHPDTFRLEWTRISCMYPFMGIFVLSAIALGWCLQVRAHLAATLIMQFLVGLGTGTVSMATVYGQDLLPGKGGAVSASLNLVRCAFGAIGTGTV